LLKFGKHKTTHKTLLNHFPASELWIHCAPLTWQEQEDFGPEVHFGALLGALCFASVSVDSWIVIIICSLFLQVSMGVHRTHNSATYKST